MYSNSHSSKPPSVDVDYGCRALVSSCQCSGTTVHQILYMGGYAFYLSLFSTANICTFSSHKLSCFQRTLSYPSVVVCYCIFLTLCSELSYHICRNFVVQLEMANRFHAIVVLWDMAIFQLAYKAKPKQLAG